ncbi:MAG: helix-hairpin-helix domain-containing protein [Bacilli bacterium]|nr:helix-hairpin-helix domain-containing protein [Bacilli bacterium]
MKKYKSKIFAVVFIIFILLAVGYVFSDEKEEVVEETVIEEKKKTDKEEKKEEKVIVDIKGQVVNPGVYELSNKNNVNDAISAAGGLTEFSDTSNINLSKKLSDEMVIIIYSKEDIRKMKESKSENEKIVCPPVNDACIIDEDESAILEEESDDIGLININSASKEELMTLEGVGESKADAIIKYREKNGIFKTIEDIKNVSGIGEKAFEKIKDSITV